MEESNTGKKQKKVKTIISKLDEVKLQTHLLNLEVKDQINFLSGDKQIIKRNLKLLVPMIVRAVKEVQTSVRSLGSSLNHSYGKIKSEIADLYSRKM